MKHLCNKCRMITTFKFVKNGENFYWSELKKVYLSYSWYVCQNCGYLQSIGNEKEEEDEKG